MLSLPHHRLGFDSYLNELKCGLPEELELVMRCTSRALNVSASEYDLFEGHLRELLRLIRLISNLIRSVCSCLSDIQRQEMEIESPR